MVLASRAFGCDPVVQETILPSQQSIIGETYIFAVTRLDSQVMSVKPLHGWPAGAEVPVDRVLGYRRALNPDGNRSDAYGEDAPPVPPGA